MQPQCNNTLKYNVSVNKTKNTVLLWTENTEKYNFNVKKEPFKTILV